MQIAEAAAIFIAVIAGAASVIALYLKLAEQWLKDKNEQVTALVEHSYFSFVDSLDSACSARKKYKKKSRNDALTTVEYETLMESVGGIDCEDGKYTKWEGVI